MQRFQLHPFVLKNVYVYAPKALSIPMAEATMTTHFQQYVLFSFIFVKFMNVNVGGILFGGLLMIGVKDCPLPPADPIFR